MKLLLQLAVRNLLRRRRRTVLTFLVLSFGVAVFLIYTAVLEGFNRASFENMINFETGHFTIRSRQWDPDDRYNITNALPAGKLREIYSAVSAIPAITAAAPRLRFPAEADNSRDALPCIVTGIDPILDPQVFTLTNYIARGRFNTNGMLIGQQLAENLNLTTGDSAFLTFRRGSGTYDSVLLEITGIILAGDPQVNRTGVFISLSLAQQLMQTDRVSELSLRSRDAQSAGTILPQLSSQLTSYKVVSWQQMSSSIAAVRETKNSVSLIFLFFIGIIALTGIINTVLLSVFEQQREIGTLKALGMTDRAIRRLFVLEGGLIGVCGTLAGILCGSAVVWYFSVHGIDMSALLQDSSLEFGFRVLGKVKAVPQTVPLIQAAIFSPGAALLAGYLPARKTTRLQPADCLRTVQ